MQEGLSLVMHATQQPNAAARLPHLPVLSPCEKFLHAIIRGSGGAADGTIALLRFQSWPIRWRCQPGRGGLARPRAVSSTVRTIMRSHHRDTRRLIERELSPKRSKPSGARRFDRRLRCRWGRGPRPRDHVAHLTEPGGDLRLA